MENFLWAYMYMSPSLSDVNKATTLKAKWPRKAIPNAKAYDGIWSNEILFFDYS